MGGWSQTMLIIVLNSCLKTGDVQSGLAADNSCSRGSGRGPGSSMACGFEQKMHVKTR